MHKKIAMRLIPALIAVSFSGGAFAAAFQLTGQSASGVGIANAGEAASAEDTSTLYYNPAGMTQLSGVHLVWIPPIRNTFLYFHCLDLCVCLFHRVMIMYSMLSL